MAAISLGTDVDAPRGEKMDENGNFRKICQNMRPGCPTASCGGVLKFKRSLTPAA